MYVQRNNEARSRNHFCHGKEISMTHSGCMPVALFFQRTKRMRHIVLSPVAYLCLQDFSTLSHKVHNFQRELLNIKCVVSLSLQLSFETFLIVRRIGRDITDVDMSSCKVPFIVSRF